MQEQWKQITDFPKYEISNTGLVRNSKGVILKPQANTNLMYIGVKSYIITFKKKSKFAC